MSLLKLIKVKKYFGNKEILNIDKFEMNLGERIGLIGANGVGKTTLLKILVGEVKADSGNVKLTDSYVYIPQQNERIEIERNRYQKLLNSPLYYEDYLSGGEKMKLKILNAFDKNVKLIIIDEPTSNLDLETGKKIETIFKKCKGSLLFVSHDRNFLNNICNKIVELEDGKLREYNGNYDFYEQQKQVENQRKKFEYDCYIRQKNNLQSSINKKKQASRSIKKTPKRMGISEARLHKMGGQKQRKKIDKNVKSLKNKLSKLEMKENLKENRPVKITIPEGNEIIGKNIVTVEKLSLKLGNKLLLEDVSFNIVKNKKTGLIGENGSGKTSLIKCILNYKDSLNELNKSIRINPNVKIGYFDQEQSILNSKINVIENIKYDSQFDDSFIRINLNIFGFDKEMIYSKIDLLSCGEKVKLSILKVILSDNNFLILDEPTNYLDLYSIDMLEKILKNTEKTVLIVSHDERLIHNICDEVFEIKDKNITKL